MQPGGHLVLAGVAAWLARDQRGRASHAVVQATRAAPAQAEQAEREQRLEALLDMIDVAIVATDGQGRGRGVG